MGPNRPQLYLAVDYINSSPAEEWETPQELPEEPRTESEWDEA